MIALEGIKSAANFLDKEFNDLNQAIATQKGNLLTTLDK